MNLQLHVVNLTSCGRQSRHGGGSFGSNDGRLQLAAKNIHGRIDPKPPNFSRLAEFFNVAIKRPKKFMGSRKTAEKELVF